MVPCHQERRRTLPLGFPRDSYNWAIKENLIYTVAMLYIDF